MKKILVTGGAGFIGCNFLYFMTDKYKEYDFVCLDMLVYKENFINLDKLIKKNNFKFVKGDIRDFIFLDSFFKKEKFDTVINFAAETHVDTSIKNPKIFLETNICGTFNLLEMSKKYEITRFHQISTDEVYGDLPLDKPEEKFTELSLVKPSSPYSVSKASGDFYCSAYYRTYGLPITISRCSNNYGPYQYPEKLIPLTFLKAMKDEFIPVYGNGNNVRDWIYVDDHNSAIDLILHKGEIGNVYNVGGHAEKSNIYVVTKILEILKKPMDLIKFVPDRLGHDKRYAISTKKIEKDLNWHLSYSFEDGLEKTLNFYKNNFDWFENIYNKKNI